MAAAVTAIWVTQPMMGSWRSEPPMLAPMRSMVLEKEMVAVPGALCVMVALFGIRETGRPSPDESDRKPAKNVAPDTSGAVLPGAFYMVLIAVTLFSLGNSSDMFLVMR